MPETDAGALSHVREIATRGTRDTRNRYTFYLDHFAMRLKIPDVELVRQFVRNPEEE
ncbi:hypothetical protein PT974_02737 [Cladobotryum mycophilum]|uniref:Uncharacterized protein n=1 Tax=Cladobotryum mycophilum TaxID=491253 RepID=A0ABR0T084_9HYPO